MVLRIFLSLIIGYIFGLFQTAYFVGLYAKKDLRKLGSGNLGATNVLRNLGLKAGIITYLGDALKAVLACTVIKLIFGSYNSELIMLIMFAGFGVMMGHCFPFYLNFKGGKGIASLSGIMLMVDYRMTIIGMIIFIALVIIKKYVSLASIVLSFYFMVAVDFEVAKGMLHLDKISGLLTIVLMMFMLLLTIFQHRVNIYKLLSGTESKVGRK